jgi:hypothetical protein
MADTPPRLTRQQLVTALNAAGIPTTIHTLNKLCMPSCNEGPPVACYWGRRPLYDPATALRWAEARLKPAPTAAEAA